MAFSTIREDTFSIGLPQVHVPKSDRRPAQARVERLARVGLAAEARLEVEVLPHRVDGGPEGGRRELDDRVPHGVLDLSVLHEVRLPARMPMPYGGMNDLPAWLASRPRTRSASVGWPHDSWDAMPATCGPATRSILPSGDFLPSTKERCIERASSITRFRRSQAAIPSQPPDHP